MWTQVASIPTALTELHRVLKTKGKAAVLDFNNASKTNPVVDTIQGWALENIVVPSARSYGLEDEYQYLRPSIQAFPPGKQIQGRFGGQYGQSCQKANRESHDKTFSDNLSAPM